MTRPLLLDLFCGPGGAAVGYERAGFEVVGVDIAEQRSYPYPYLRRDWEDGLRILADEADAFHASPPCQAWSRLGTAATGFEYPKLIDEVRAALVRIGKPWVIENVERAPLQNCVTLCGTQFGLQVRRHRQFETDPMIFDMLPPCWCRGRVASGELIGQRFGTETRGRKQPPHRAESERRAALECDWMTSREARQAIPPRYTEWLGSHLIKLVSAE